MPNITNPLVTEYLNGLYRAPSPELGKLRQQAEAEGVPILTREAESCILSIIRAKLAEGNHVHSIDENGLETARPFSILEIGTAVGYSAMAFASCDSCVTVDTIEINPDTAVRAVRNFEKLAMPNIFMSVCGDAKEILDNTVGFYNKHPEEYYSDEETDMVTLELSEEASEDDQVSACRNMDGYDSKEFCNCTERAALETGNEIDRFLDRDESLKEYLVKESSETLMGCNYDMMFIDAAKSQYMDYFKAGLKLLKKGGIIISDNVLMKGGTASGRYDPARRFITSRRHMREYLEYITDCPDVFTSVLPVGDGLAISVILSEDSLRRNL